MIFIASIMVPSLKMLAIGWLCWDANGRKKPRADSERMHLIYEVVEFVGRWSTIDVFVIAVLSALRMGQLMSIYPATGAVLFALVVILTMFAAMTFDPRLTGIAQVKQSTRSRKVTENNHSVADVEKIKRWSPVWISHRDRADRRSILFYHFSHQPVVTLVTTTAEGLEAGKTKIKAVAWTSAWWKPSR